MPKYLFSNINELETFKNDINTSIITDIDGTISEIVPTPMEATVSPEIKNKVEKTAKRFKYVGVMTGRSIDNAMDIMGSQNLIYIGNHGLEQFKNGKIHVDPEVEKYIPLIKNVSTLIQEKLNKYDCILFQDKELSFTVHYRLCDNDEEIRKIALDIIKDIDGSNQLKIAEGRKVIEIRPPIGHDKGTILEKFILENNIKKMIYLGDDITDSNAFYKLKELNHKNDIKAKSIVVVSNETPDYVRESADYYVKSVKEIQKFFNWISES
ncbi:MAG: trehalose-phosphatase [Methanobacterium sp.]